MTLNLHDALNQNGLFDIQGKAFHALDTLNTARLTTVPDEMVDLLESLQLLTADLDMSGSLEGIPSSVTSWQSAGNSLASKVGQTCETVLRQMVAGAAAQPEDNLTFALEYLIDVMLAGGYYVDASTVGLTLTPAAGNHGDLVIVYSDRRGDGRASPHLLAESIAVEVVAESTTSPTLEFSSPAKVGNLLSQDWPGGSGITVRLSATSAASSLLSNGDFEDAEIANVPDDWIIQSGTPGTTVALTNPEVQTVAISGTPTGGSYVLEWTNPAGITRSTATLAYNASASTVQSALREIPGLEAVTVSAAGTSPDYTHTITFWGTPGDPGQLTSVSHLTGGTAPRITHATTTAGDPGAYLGAALAITGNSPDAYGHTLLELTSLYHALSLATNTLYFCHFRVRRGPDGSTSTTSSTTTTTTATPADQIRVAIVEEIGGAVTTDPAGNSNQVLLDAAAVSDTAHDSVWFAFSLQEDVSFPVYLEIAVTAALAAGRTIYFDELAVVRGTQLYVGGPYVAAFTGTSEAVNGDSWTLQVSNNRGGAIQEWYHRCFNMAALGLMLPVSGSVNLPDTLIA